MSGKDREFTEWDERFARAVGHAVAEGVKPLAEKLERIEGSVVPPTTGMTPDERHELMMSELRGKGRPGPPESTIEGCRSEDTGATFNARTVSGKVVNLDAYTLPAGLDKHVSEGGLVPEGMVITNEGDDWAYRQWVWTTFWQADLRRFIGKPLPPSARPRAAA